MIHEVLNHLWQSTLFAGAAGLLTLCFRRNGASVRYAIWFVASCKFLFPFAVLMHLGSRVPLRIASAPSAPMHPLLGDLAVPFSSFPSELPIPATAAVPRAAIDPQWIWLGIWACGVVAVTTYWLVRWVQVRAAFKKAVPLSLGLPIVTRSSPEALEPGIVGFFRPVLLLPEGICDRLSPRELELVLAHELSHFRRRDNLTAAAQMLIEAAVWFHPLVWWIGVRLNAEREAACDEAVLASRDDPETYAQAIIAVCKFYLKMPLECASGVSGGRLKKRIDFIMTSRPALKLSAARKALLATAATAAVTIPLLAGSMSATITGMRRSIGNFTGMDFQKVVIRESRADGDFPHDIVSSDGYTAENFQLRSIIAFAFDGQDALELGPKILDTRYDIVARTPRALTAAGYEGIEQLQAMVREMLAEKFHLEVHRSSRTIRALALTASPSGAQVQQARAGDAGVYFDVEPAFIDCKAVTMSDFARLLARLELGQPVLDRTGLSGTYNFRLNWKWPPGSNSLAGNNSAASSSRTEEEALVHALESQLGLTLRMEQTTAPFLVVDRVDAPKDLLPAYKAVPMEPQDFDRYAGHYQFPGGSIMTVSRDNEHYWTQLTGQERVEIFPDANGEFFTKVVDAEISFQSNAKGQTTGLVLHQNGRDIQAPRMDEVAAEKLLNALNLRIENKIPIPGSGQALRRLTLELASGKPDYERMRPELAADTREQLVNLQKTMTRVGPLVSLKFIGVDPWGWDSYELKFARAKLEGHIALETGGVIKGAWYGPIN